LGFAQSLFDEERVARKAAQSSFAEVERHCAAHAWQRRSQVQGDSTSSASR
jgi:hypothetical protein